MQFAKMMLQKIVLLFNTKRFIPVNFDGSYYASIIDKWSKLRDETQWENEIARLLMEAIARAAGTTTDSGLQTSAVLLRSPTLYVTKHGPLKCLAQKAEVSRAKYCAQWSKSHLRCFGNVTVQTYLLIYLFLNFPVLFGCCTNTIHIVKFHFKISQ
jgi:hypothetical protein